jgi:hypothetical protein
MPNDPMHPMKNPNVEEIIRKEHPDNSEWTNENSGPGHMPKVPTTPGPGRHRETEVLPGNGGGDWRWRDVPND